MGPETQTETQTQVRVVDVRINKYVFDILCVINALERYRPDEVIIYSTRDVTTVMFKCNGKCPDDGVANICGHEVYIRVHDNVNNEELHKLFYYSFYL